MRNEGQEDEEEPSPGPGSAAAPVNARGPGPGKRIPVCLGRGKDGFARGISAMIAGMCAWHVFFGTSAP